MKKILLVALTAVGLTACVQNEELAVNKPTAAITFADSFVNSTTRVANPVITSTNLTGFDVWAFMDEVGGTVLTDEDVVKNGDTWGYSNIQYWFPDHTYYFAALAPMNSANITSKTLATSDAAKLGLGEIAFTNVDGTEDLLYAKTSVDTPDITTLTNAGMDAVNIQFQHLLSKVRFTFNNGFLTPGIKVVVTDVKMTAPKSGTIDLAQATYNNAWVLDQGEITLDFGDVEELDATQSASAANERFSIPATDAYKYNVTFHVAVWNGTVKAYELDKEAIIDGHALEMGKAYNFTAVLDHTSLNLHAIEFTAEVDEWVDANNPETEIAIDYYIDDVGNFVVANESGLQAIAEGINEGTIDSGVSVVLGGDVDLNNLPRNRSVVSNWTPIGSSEDPFTGTFDGNGYTIKNLALVESEAKEGKAYIGFFGYAKDATIKNVTFENVYINIPCLDIDHSQGHIGAVAGSLEGTSTIENVTVKGDITVYATQDANGASRVGVIAGGNSYGNVTIKNVHVIANDGSSLIANNNTGAIAGQLQGNTVYENCSSNIDVTVNKFFAGGIVGLAGSNDKFINCHTTGDVSVVAGRSGKAHDHYRVGGIAGGWADGKNNVCTLENCSYTGKLTGINADGSVAETFDYMGYVGRGYTLNGCQGSKVVIDGTEFVQIGNTAAEAGIYSINGCTPVSTAAELVATLEAGEGAYLLNDIEYTGTIVISKEQNAVIDLGGKTLSSVDTTEKNYELIKNAGTLLVRNGTMKVEATHNNGWNRYSAVIANTVGGNLTVENAYLEHLGGTDMSYGIDNLTNGKGTYAVTTIQNTTVKSSYRAVRQFLNGTEATNELYVKAGSVLEGVNKSIFFHDPSKSANSGKLVVEDGAELKGDVYLFVTAGSTEWPVEVSIAASALVGDSEVISGNVPEGYTVELVNGTWTVVK